MGLKRKVRNVLKSGVLMLLCMSMICSNTIVYATESTTESETQASSDSSTTGSTGSTESGSSSSGASNTAYSSDGTAMGRAKVFIRKAAGKNVVSDTEEMANMTKEDLRFLGVYISNFFVPFGTEFGVNTKMNEKNQSDIVAALKSNLNFDETTAKSLADTLIGLTRSNNSELVFCVSNEYQKELVPLDDVVLNQYTFTQAMSGHLPDMMLDELPEDATDFYTWALQNKDGNKETEKETEKEEEDDIIPKKTKWNMEQNIRIIAPLDGYISAFISVGLKQEDDVLVKDDVGNKKSYNWGYLAFKDGSSYTPVFDFRLYEEDGLSACQFAYLKCLESVKFEKGYGMNIFDFSNSELGDGDDYEKVSELFTSDDDWYKMSCFGSRLRVDCFGNIIIMGANHQFVAIPACVNPYTWVAVDEKGSDDPDHPGGSVYNMINMMSMAYQDGKKLFTSSKSGAEARIKSGKGATKALAGRVESSSYDLRDHRGSDTTNLGLGGGLLKFFNTDASKALRKAMNGANANNDYCISAPWGSSVINQKSVSVDLPAIEGGTFSYTKKKNINFFDSMVFIDNLGAYHFDKSNSDIDLDKWEAFNVEHYIGTKEKTLAKLGSGLGSGFDSVLSKVEDGAMSTIASSDNNKAGVVSIFVSYIYAGLYDDDSKEKTIGKLGYKMNVSIFPEIANDPIGSDGSLGDDIMSTSIKQWLYYLLHPTSGYNYVTQLISNKLRAFMVNWHNDMLGTKGVGVITGTTKYRGTSGYVTTPDLSEMEWTSNLISFWESGIPFIAILTLVVFAFVYLAGILSLQRCIIGVIVFCIGLLIPVPLINGVVGVSNRVVSNLYGEKFTYWAMVQHETYSDAIDEAATGDSYGNYLRTIYSQNNAINVNQGSESVKLKWQAPKKMVSLMLSENDNKTLSGFRKSFITGAINNAYSAEAYLDDDSCYLYRSYLDISNFSRYIYRGIRTEVRKSRNGIGSKGSVGSNLDPTLRDNLMNYSTTQSADKSKGYTNGSMDSSTDNGIRVSVPVSSRIYNDALAGIKKIGSMGIDDYVGINQDYFNFSIPMFNKKDSDGDDGFSLEKSMLSSAKSEEFKKDVKKKKYSEADLTGLAAYGLYSESVFYYFSWYLYDCGLDYEAGSLGYKDLLLGGDNASFFYNTKGNGELKDIMDMRSLFTYIIPYLHAGNKVVKKFDNTYGIKYYPGVTTEEGHADEFKNDEELRQKYWHNLNISRLYEIYTPWVDLMYDCGYAEPETIKVLGENVKIKDPLDPASYPSDRPMIFSRSEMVDAGLREGDLTKVEKLILKCNDDYQESLFELLNYYTFNDVVLDTAAAMNCAFVFNKNFSESKILGNNVEIYPQTFEISDFSYDAFLRFILSNSTGESMLNGDDFYMNIAQSSSLTASIVMIVLDIASVYVLPGVKIFFLVLVFLSAILVILVSILHVDEEQKFIPRMITGVVSPMIKYFLITMGMSYLISLFMGVGNDSVTHTNTSTIQLGDPVMVMIAMLLIDIIVIILYYRTIKAVWASVKRMGKLVGGVGSGCLAAVGGIVTGSYFVNKLSKSGGFASSSSGGGNSGSGETSGGASNDRASRRGNTKLDDTGSAMGNDAEYGDDRQYETYTDPTVSNASRGDYDEEYAKKRKFDIEEKTKAGLERARQRNRDNRRADRVADRAAERASDRAVEQYIRKQEKYEKDEERRKKKEEATARKREDRKRDNSNKSNAKLDRHEPEA